MALALFMLFFVLKQFYLFPSGGLGVADVCLVLCCLVLLGEWLFKRRAEGNRSGAGGKLLDWKEDWPFYLFLVCVVVINGVYAWKEKNTEFVRYTAYWLYNGMAIWCFRRLGQKEGFARWVVVGAQVNILVQTGVWLSGHGRLFYEYWGGTRYMGTFNDPNQLAFFVFLMAVLLYLSRGESKKLTDGIFYLLAIGIIGASKSTGVFLGVLAAAAAFAVRGVYRLYCSRRVARHIWWIGGAVCVLLLAAAVVFLWPPADFSIQEGNFTLVERIQEKIWKVAHGGLGGLLMDRGMEKLWLYPGCLLTGAGEGGFARFTLAAQVNEIHSCLFSILFCYGILPTAILMFWLFREFRSVRGWMWPVILGLLAESFLLVNYRQPMFWLVLIWGSLVREHSGCK